MKTDSGLLKRAAAIRTLMREASASGSSGPASQDPEAGITAEERREISAAIDVVARSNRLSSGDASALVAARKRGILLPLVVNIAAVVVTALILVLLARAFASGQTAIMDRGASMSSAEGILLQELKRESDSRLAEKDRAISSIQAKMLALDKERLDLTATIDERIKAREAELKAQLQEALKNEKARLEAQGVAEAVIAERLKAFEAQKTKEFQGQLDAFKAQAEKDRIAADENYRKLKDEYSANMIALGEERKKLLSDAKAREDQLRATIDSRTRDLEAKGAAASAALDKAKAELTKLQDRQNAAQSAEDRVIGLYAAIRQALQDRRFDDAARSADALASYLDDPAVAGLPALQARRSVDLFVAQTLASEARTELRGASEDTSRLLDQARILGEARDAAKAADAARRSGDAAAADAKYAEALNRVPEILAAHQWFMQKAAAEDAARRDSLGRSMAAADLAWKAGDPTEALARYGEALAYLPVADADRSRMLQRLGQLAVAEADRRRTASETASAFADSKAAQAALDSGARALAAGKWSEAIGSYLEVLSNWPASSGRGVAIDGLKAAGAGLDRSLSKLETQAAGDREAAQAKSGALADDLAKAASERDAAIATNSELSAKIAALQVRIDSMAKENSRLAAQLSSVPPAAAVSAASLDIVALQKQVDDLRNLESRWIGITEAYGGFIVDAGEAKGDSTAELASLRSFLADPRVRGTFGRLASTLDHILAEWGSQSSVDAVHNAAFIAVQAASIKDAKARDRFLAGQAGLFAQDSFVSAFVQALREAWR